MTRTKTVSLFLIAMLFLAVVAAPLAGFGSQYSFVTQLGRENPVSMTESSTPHVIQIACDGCSGGGGTGG